MTKNTLIYYEAVGRRKEATARVRLTADSKSLFLINDRAVTNYFSTNSLRNVVSRPLAEQQLTDKFSVSAKIIGGGVSAQAQALALAIARALIKYDVNLKPTLKKSTLLKRDSRIKERRKFGLKKARKAPQWSKR